MRRSAVEVLVVSRGVRWRCEPFGGIAWTHLGCIMKLSPIEAVLLNVLSVPTDVAQLNQLVPSRAELMEAIERLVETDIIERTDELPISGSVLRWTRALSESARATEHSIPRPFWVHLQPFTFCNLECTHCYCHGSPLQPKLHLSVDEWKNIIDRVTDFGVLEIYITGGEGFIVPEFFELVRYIMNRGCITGLSTNGITVRDEALDFIRELGFDFVQVSLDGATAEVNDAIRGRGTYRKTLQGIERLNSVTEVILNMVVGELNYHQIEELIQLGVDLGVRRFKFFPQKWAGRAATKKAWAIPYDAWESIVFDTWEIKYGVEIDYMKLGTKCGSGSSGFAIDERGDVYPCIFGIHNQATRLGSLLDLSLNELWYESKKLREFRERPCEHPCNRCEF